MAIIDKSNDIKIGGTLSTAAVSNRLAHAEEIYDESWNGDEGLDQSSINAKLLGYITEGTGGVIVNDSFKVVSTDNYVFSLIDKSGNKLISVTIDNQVEINDELLTLSGYSIRTEDLQEGFIKAVIDANGYMLMAIKEDGTCIVYKNLEVGGDTITLSEGDAKVTMDTSNPNIIFAVVDANGNMLFWVNKDGTADFNGVPSDVAVAIENVNTELTTEITEVNETVTTLTGQLYVKETSDGLITMVDAEENRLLTVTESGQIEINNELFADSGYSIKVKDTTADSLFHIVDKEGKVIFNIQSSGKVVIGDGLVIDNAKSGMSITSKGTDAIFAVTDANGNVLLWITEDGLVDFKGIPSDVLTEVTTIHNTLNSLTSNVYVTESSDGLVTIIDNEENRLLTISETGQVEINNELLANEGYSIKVKETDADSLFHIVDKDAKVLFNILSDGQVTIGNGIVIDNAKAGMKVLTAETDALLAIVDKDGKILAAVNQYGALMANAITGVCEVNTVDNEDWALVCMDKSGNVLFGVLKDGSFYCHSLSSEYFSEGSSEEFVYIILSKNGKLLFGIRSDGTIYSQGITEGAKEAIEELTVLYDNLKDYAESHGGVCDWSDTESVQFATPRCAYLNIISDKLPTAKSGMGTVGSTCDIPCQIEVWDMQGNYFKKWVLLSAQGNSSLAFTKKNFAMDIFLSKDDALNDGDTFEIKIGDWVTQDSYHFKAYYTDIFRGRCVVSYWLYEEMVETRDMFDDRPYKQQFTGGDDFTATSNFGDNELDLDTIFETGARCFPDGFPVIITWNGAFYGVYSWQLKKHRDNFWMNKKTAEHVHLDGTLGDQIWLGSDSIDWTAFEIRNPKSLYMQEYHTIRGEETLEYNGDYPYEIMGKDSEYYDSSDKDMKRCATAKGYIEALADYNPALLTLKSDGATDDEIREQFEKWFDPSFMVDYVLETNLVSDGDGYAKNWQWTTWDGVRWVPNPYDMDGIFGAYHVGNYISAPSSGKLGNSSTRPSYWIWNYYMDELKARWKELRDARIFDAAHICDLLMEWINRVGYGNYKLEYEKWSESPCCRPSNVNADYWSRSGSYLTVTSWTETTTFAKSAYCSYNSVVYQSLTADNVGNIPSEDTDNWVRVYYDEDATYAEGDTCVYGWNQRFVFKAVQECSGVPPMENIYTLYPRELGCYDSIYRVYNWLVKRISYMDGWFDYEG